MSSSPAIRTEALTRDFGRLRAVDRLTLRVPRGIIFGFLGPNGAGKTTTIQLLLGLIESTAGRAEVLGFDTRNQAARIRDRAGALLEHAGLYERLSAEDNLDFAGRTWRMSGAARQARIKELLGRVDLWDRRKERVGAWSRGMKQKLAVARALMHRPALVFLDEPTDGLDPLAAAALRDDLAGLAAHEGVTLFLTTHNLVEAERLCQQVAVIRGGRLLAQGRPDELREGAGQPGIEVVGRGFGPPVIELLNRQPTVAGVEATDDRLLIRLRESGSAALLVSLLVQAGVEIEEVLKKRASLEEAFLDLVREPD